MNCPKPTQDVVLNLKNRQKAIDKVGYGPLNPSEDNDKFWQAKADIWDVSISDAKKQLCSNCAAFNRSEEMLSCIDKGMGGEEKDSWDVIDAGQLGYCEMLDFKCAASRTCDAWVDGNAKMNSEEKVTMLDAYFQKVDAFLAVIEAKDADAAGTYEIDVETKVRKVKDSAYWGRPVGTPITPGMKPEGPKSPLGRARAAAGGGGTSGRGSGAKPKKRIRPAMAKPSKPAGGERSEIAGGDEDKPEIAGGDPSMGKYSFDTPRGNRGNDGDRRKKKRRSIRPKRPVTQEREDRGPEGMSDDEREEFNMLDKPGKDKYTGARQQGYDHENSLDYAEGIEGNQVERDAQNDPDSDFARAVESGKLREWTDKQKERGLDGDEVLGLSDAEVYDSYLAVGYHKDKDKNERYAKGRVVALRTALKYADDDNEPAAQRSAMAHFQDIVDNPDKHPDNIVALAKEKLGKKNIPQSDDKSGPNTKVVDAKDFSVGKAAAELKKIKKDGRKDGTGSEADPIDVGADIELAHKLLSEGKHIRMKDERAVSTLLDKLHETVKDAKEKGDKAPEYDLCKVSVPKTNLFCVESKGIPRTKMPQFKGTPVDGSFADTRKNDKGEGDVEPEFRELLKELGINTEMSTVKASELRASQDNLDGPKVVGMAQAMREGKIPDAPIFVTKDGYILDGHHRWAAKVAIDLDDGVSGDIEMPVEIIDAEIGYLIDLANGFTEIAGIKPKGLGAAAEGVKRLVINPDGTLCIPCMAQ